MEVRSVQCFLRRDDNDSLSGLCAHCYGSSHANQQRRGGPYCEGAGVHCGLTCLRIW
jgi:hypothetical protein